MRELRIGKAPWIAGFLSLTVLAIIAECFAAFDDSAETVPWTDLIVEYVPGEIFAVVLGALMLWVPVHFGIRYYKKSKGIDWRAAAQKKRKKRLMPPV